MNSMKSTIKENVQKTLESLDGVEQAKLDSFFYTRLQARMEKQQSSLEAVSWWSTIKHQFSLQWVLVFAIAVLNIYSLYNFWSSSVMEERENDLSIFAKEYTLVENNYTTLN